MSDSYWTHRKYTCIMIPERYIQIEPVSLQEMIPPSKCGNGKYQQISSSWIRVAPKLDDKNSYQQ